MEAEWLWVQSEEEAQLPGQGKPCQAWRRSCLQWNKPGPPSKSLAACLLCAAAYGPQTSCTFSGSRLRLLTRDTSVSCARHRASCWAPSLSGRQTQLAVWCLVSHLTGTHSYRPPRMGPGATARSNHTSHSFHLGRGPGRATHGRGEGLRPTGDSGAGAGAAQRRRWLS